MNEIIYRLRELDTLESRILADEIAKNPEKIDWAGSFDFLLSNTRTLKSELVQDNNSRIYDSISFFIRHGVWTNLASCFKSLPNEIVRAMKTANSESLIKKDQIIRYQHLDRIVKLPNIVIRDLIDFLDQKEKNDE